MSAYNLYDLSSLSKLDTAEKQRLLDLANSRARGNYVEPMRELVKFWNDHKLSSPLLCNTCPSADTHINELLVPFLEKELAVSLVETLDNDSIESTIENAPKRKKSNGNKNKEN